MPDLSDQVPFHSGQVENFYLLSVSVRVHFLRFWRNKVTADALTVCLCVFRDAHKNSTRTKLRLLYVLRSEDFNLPQ